MKHINYVRIEKIKNIMDDGALSVILTMLATHASRCNIDNTQQSFDFFIDYFKKELLTYRHIGFMHNFMVYNDKSYKTIAQLYKYDLFETLLNYFFIIKKEIIYENVELSKSEKNTPQYFNYKRKHIN